MLTKASETPRLAEATHRLLTGAVAVNLHQLETPKNSNPVAVLNMVDNMFLNWFPAIAFMLVPKKPTFGSPTMATRCFLKRRRPKKIGSRTFFRVQKL